jgi:hypothetical protein
MSSSGRRYAEGGIERATLAATSRPEPGVPGRQLSTRYVSSAPSRSAMWFGVTRVSTEIAETKAAVIGSARTLV